VTEPLPVGDEQADGPLNAARLSLQMGRTLSKQAAYARRAPQPESLPYFDRARELLTQILNELPNDRAALLMLSEIAECVLDYDTAVDFQNRAFDAGEPRTKKLLKRQALLMENAIAWKDLRLTPGMLDELGKHLEVCGVDASHRTLQFTRTWLAGSNVSDPDAIVQALERRGAFSDFQVLANVVYG